MHFQALKGMSSAVGYADHQAHIRTVPSESPENRFSPSWENTTVWASLSWPIILRISPDLRSNKWIAPLLLAWANTRPERGGEKERIKIQFLEFTFTSDTIFFFVSFVIQQTHFMSVIKHEFLSLIKNWEQWFKDF